MSVIWKDSLGGGVGVWAGMVGKDATARQSYQWLRRTVRTYFRVKVDKPGIVMKVWESVMRAGGMLRKAKLSGQATEPDASTELLVSRVSSTNLNWD